MAKQTVGAIELPDHAMDYLSNYTRDAEFEIVLAVTRDPNSQLAAMAGILQVPLYREPMLEELMGCQLLLLGDPNCIPDSWRTKLVEANIEIRELSGPTAESAHAAHEPLIEPGYSMEEEPVDKHSAQDTPPPLPPSKTPEPVSAPSPNPAPSAEPEPAPALSVVQPADPLGPEMQIEPGNPGVMALLNEVRNTTGADTASIMLPDKAGHNLFVTASLGLENEITNRPHPVGRGLAGRVYTSGRQEGFCVQDPGFAESGESDKKRIAASVPIRAETKVIGVLSINVELRGEGEYQGYCRKLAPFAVDATRTLVKAIDLSRLDAEELQEQLLRQVDQLMAMDENLPSRLSDAADVLRYATGADYAHLYLVDEVGSRLSPVTDNPGMGKFVSTALNRGFMSWVLKSGTSHVMMSEHNGERRGNAYLPVKSTAPRGVVLLENVSTSRLQPEELKQVLDNVGGLLGEMLLVEEGMGAQELLADLKMRIADASAELENGTEEERLDTLLKLGLELTSASVAVWVPAGGGPSKATEPETEVGRKILAESWQVMEALTRRARSSGSHSWGISEEAQPPETPLAPSPYAAVCAKDGNDVLVLFFEPEDQAAYRQIPEGAVIDLMSRLIQHMPTKPGPEAVGDAPRVAAMMDLEGLAEVALEEWRRSGRTGRAFAVTRLGFADAKHRTSENMTKLAQLIVDNKRTIDSVAECSSGEYVLVTPETDNEQVWERFVHLWDQNASGGGKVICEQRLYPRDGKTEAELLAWLGAGRLRASA